MEKYPLVSVICLCYNHEKFLEEALDSVLNQTYPNLEVIVIDDFSTDNSRFLLETYAKKHPQIKYLPAEKNLGNCAAFNRAFAISSGKYIIDFATDDVLLPTRIAEQVAVFETLGPEYGILFTDAVLIDDSGNTLGYFYQRNSDGSLKQHVPSGYVFAEVLQRHFISTPTMIIRRSVFEKLGGYDATLAYEDFDLWVRSARDFKYYFLDKPLTKRRLHPAQLSKKQYKPSDRQIFSTIQVCRKAVSLIKTQEEKHALVSRIEHELTQTVFTENKEASQQFLALLQEINAVSLKSKVLRLLSKIPLPLNSFRRLYYRWKYK